MGQSNSIPKKSAGDVVHTIIKAAIGGPAGEVFNAIIAPPIEKRREEWIQGIVERLRKLENKVEGISIENLQQNESFITSLLEASNSALRTHHKAKLEALQNAVLNSALPNAIEDDMNHIFLRLIDRYSPSHIRMLKIYYEADIEYFKRKNPNLVYIVREHLTAAFPDIMKRLDFYYHFFSDIIGDNLVTATYSGTGLSLLENLKRFEGLGVISIQLKFQAICSW